MILTCDGDVRDRFQSVMDGVAVAGGGRPGSAAREGEPEDYTVIPLLFPNPFLPLPTFRLRSFLFFILLFPVIILSMFVFLILLLQVLFSSLRSLFRLH